MRKSEKIKAIILIIFGIICLYAAYKHWPSKIVEKVEQSTFNNNTSLLRQEEFKEMFSDPNKFKGRSVDFYAKVFVTPRNDTEMTYIQAYSDPETSSENSMIQIKDTPINIKNGDTIHVVGKVEKEFDSENAFGGNVSVPLITASKIEKADYGTAFEPAITTMSVNKEIDQNGYVIKVNTVNFAKNNTRVYLTVTNNSKNQIYFNTNSARATQGDKEFNIDVGNENYPELDTKILPGVKEDGVVVFKPMNPNASSTKFVFTGSSYDYNLEFNPFTFEVDMK